MEYNDLTFARHLAGLASLNPHRKPVADPATLNAIQLVDKMIQIEDHVRTIYVCNDKPADAQSKDHVTGIDLSLSSELALYSCIAKASAAQNDRDAELNYPEAYASTRQDLYTAGLRILYVPSDVRHVTSTGAPCDPNDQHLKYLYREIWKAPQNIIAKSQSTLLSVIRAHLSDGLFTALDKTFPGSDLLQKYWLYTTSRIHSGRQSIHAFPDKISVTPIPTAEAFNAVMTQSRLLEV